MRLAAGFENITELRRDLDAIKDGLGNALAQGLAEDAAELLASAKALTPFGPGPEPTADEDSDNALPHIRDTLAVTVNGGTIALTSTHPGAIVHEWGGTIRPNGAPIDIATAAMTRKAAVAELPDIERAVEQRIDRLVKQHSL